jgi:hypothetical protein
VGVRVEAVEYDREIEIAVGTALAASARVERDDLIRLATSTIRFTTKRSSSGETELRCSSLSAFRFVSMRVASIMASTTIRTCLSTCRKLQTLSFAARAAQAKVQSIMAFTALPNASEPWTAM